MPFSIWANFENADGNNRRVEASVAIVEYVAPCIRDLARDILAKVACYQIDSAPRNRSLSKIYLTLGQHDYINSELKNGPHALMRSSSNSSKGFDSQSSVEELSIMIRWEGCDFGPTHQSLGHAFGHADSVVTVVVLNLLGKGKHLTFRAPTKMNATRSCDWVERYWKLKGSPVEPDPSDKGTFHWIAQSCKDACVALTNIPRFEVISSFEVMDNGGTVIAEIDGIEECVPVVASADSSQGSLEVTIDKPQRIAGAEVMDSEVTRFSDSDRKIISKLKEAGLPCEIFSHGSEADAKKFEAKYGRSYILCLRSSTNQTEAAQTCVVAGAETIEESESHCMKALNVLTAEEYSRLVFLGFSDCFEETDAICL